MSPAKAAEPIEMLTGLRTRRGGGKEQRIRSRPGLPRENKNLEVGHVPGSKYGEL